MTTAAITVANIYYILVDLYVYEETFLVQVLPVKHLCFINGWIVLWSVHEQFKIVLKKQTKWFQFSSAWQLQSKWTNITENSILGLDSLAMLWLFSLNNWWVEMK